MLKATLTPDPHFTLSINGYVVTGFRVVSSWECMEKLKSGEHEVIVARAPIGHISAAFNVMFGADQKPEDVVIVAMSPELEAAVKAVANG
jgi:hypothetical protein